MISPLDLERLAVRIETLQRTRTHGWNPADELEFRQGLPGGFARNKLPDPKWLRDLAKAIKMKAADEDDIDKARKGWRMWVPKAMNLEGKILDNDPRNPKRMMRDMVRGRFPGRR